MTRIQYTKAHGAKNDFLLTWAADLPAWLPLADAAVAICDRNSGVGADGWLLVRPAEGGEPASIRLINSDGSGAEISGNGTRCAAAFLHDAGLEGAEITIATGAGRKELRVLEQAEGRYLIEMDMGAAVIDEGGLHHELEVDEEKRECTILWVGNPQCAFFVESFDFDWKEFGAKVERHRHFPNRTNVSVVRVAGRHELDVRFFERGAGFTMSSGTGSMGAVAAAMARGLVESPVTVSTLAGPLEFRAEGDRLRMVGPAEIVARGEFYYRGA